MFKFIFPDSVFRADVRFRMVVFTFKGYNMLSATLGNNHKRTKEMADAISRVKM